MGSASCSQSVSQSVSHNATETVRIIWPYTTGMKLVPKKIFLPPFSNM